MNHRYIKYMGVEDNYVREFYVLGNIELSPTEEDFKNLFKLAILTLLTKKENPLSIEQILFSKKILDLDEDDLQIRAFFGRSIRKEFEIGGKFKVETVAKELGVSIANVNGVLYDFSSLLDFFRVIEAIVKLEKKETSFS